MWSAGNVEDSQSKLSKHAAIRAQQRSIPRVIHDALLDWGDRRKAGSGVTSYSFSKRSWGKFAKYLGAEAKRLERYRNAYIVVAGDGTIITVCWRR